MQGTKISGEGRGVPILSLEKRGLSIFSLVKMGRSCEGTTRVSIAQE